VYDDSPSDIQPIDTIDALVKRFRDFLYAMDDDELREIIWSSDDDGIRRLVVLFAESLEDDDAELAPQSSREAVMDEECKFCDIAAMLVRGMGI
jgi:hypothetical protein